VLPLKADGKTAAGKFWRYFQSENRYRDTAVSPDRKTIYVATDPSGVTEALGGSGTTTMEDRGAILAFTYTGEGSGAPVEPQAVSKAAPAQNNTPALSRGGGETPQFTAAQTAAGKTAYASNCAVCHGNNLSNGTYGPSLGGEYFNSHWSGKSLKAFYDKAKTMPPSAPGSLTGEIYANIVAYILETNGAKAGSSALTAGGDALEKMTIK
jgi:mono/diheme cytochrome c family protein